MAASVSLGGLDFSFHSFFVVTNFVGVPKIASTTFVVVSVVYVLPPLSPVDVFNL